MSDLIPLVIEGIDGQWWVTCDGYKKKGPFSDRRLAERWADTNSEPMEMESPEEERARLIMQFKHYGRHTLDCQRPRRPECTCGWDELKRTLSEAEGERR